MRGELVTTLGTEFFWEVVICYPNGHHHFVLKNKRDHPDELSAFMAVAKELEQEEQTNGNRT